METDTVGPTKLVVSSLSALLAAITGSNSEFCRIIYVPIRRDKGNASKFRNVELQEKIVSDIAKIFAFETYFTKNMADAILQISCESRKIIDVNTIGYLGTHVKSLTNVTKIVGAGSEHLSAFIPRIPSLNLKDLHLRFNILRNYFQRYGVHAVHCFVKKSSGSFFFWKSIPINLKTYSSVCNRIFQALELSPQYTFLQDLSVDLAKNPNKKLLVFLPVASHYGGVESDTQEILDHIFQNFGAENFYTLVKNHPSDGETNSTVYAGRKLVNWNTDLSRTFPVEVILNTYQERLLLVGSGSSAMFAVEKGNKFMYYPNSKWGHKLAKRNTNHLLRYFGIGKINLK